MSTGDLILYLRIECREMDDMKTYISLTKGCKLHKCLVFICYCNIEFLPKRRNQNEIKEGYFLRINDKNFKLFMYLLGIYYYPQFMPWSL